VENQHDTAALKREIEELRRTLADVTAGRSAGGVGIATRPGDTGGDNIYVFDDDDEAARAFDEFYRAYDELHAKKRRFLLGWLRR
jgi:hypothetical protein